MVIPSFSHSFLFTGEQMWKAYSSALKIDDLREKTEQAPGEYESPRLIFQSKKESLNLASIKELPDKDGKNRYHVQIRIKGSPPQ